MFLYSPPPEGAARDEALDDSWARYFSVVHDAAVARRDALAETPAS